MEEDEPDFDSYFENPLKSEKSSEINKFHLKKFLFLRKSNKNTFL